MCILPVLTALVAFLPGCVVPGDYSDDYAQRDVHRGSSVSTTTSLTSSANPALIPLSGNSTATITATVTAVGNPVTLGTVSFFNGVQALATNVTLNPSGQASFTFTTVTGSPLLGEGTHSITANNSGATGFGASNGALTQVVDRATQITGNTYCNTGTLTIPQTLNGPASVYPSKLFVTPLSQRSPLRPEPGRRGEDKFANR